MKNFLLTWYGITDLSAALGLINEDGPILGALRSGDYSDVLILGYTNGQKKGKDIVERQEESMEILEELERTGRVLQQAKAFITDSFSNTKKSHRFQKMAEGKNG